jgi:hypothetical protein
MQWLFGFPVPKADAVLLAPAPDAHLHPFGQRIHHRRADAVQSARDLIAVLVELPPRVKPGQHDLGSGNPLFQVDIGRDATPSEADRKRRRLSRKARFFEPRSGVDIRVHEHRSAENAGFAGQPTRFSVSLSEMA